MSKKKKSNEIADAPEKATYITEESCLTCRWKEHVENTGICPAVNKLIDLKNPVYDCEKFRAFKGEYYMPVKPVE